ncbi:MAG: DUF1501 domain-containing protein [Verrucomicrobia bacterium]|nr:DUF1501 domain-containing protein [Verrucomicrobiota bacterium]
MIPSTLHLPARRGFLRSLVGGSTLLPGLVSELLAEDSRRGAAIDPLAPHPPHFAPKAKRVIFLYMSGGVSHVDSWDPKPKLLADGGRTVSVNEFQGRKGEFQMYLKRPQWTFRPRGQCGTEVSDLFPHMARCVDDLCVIRSMKSDHTNHYEATLGVHTGSFNFTRPSFGSWVSYGLGTENRNLPSFVVIAPKTPYAGGQVWGSDFLPGCHQGTLVVPGAEPVANIRRRVASQELQELELELLAQNNHRHRSHRLSDPLLEARIRSYETAFGMQSEMPEVFDLSRERESTLDLYGLKRGSNDGFGWQCLVARRLIERGVRFVELIDSGSSDNWDAHGDMMAHEPLARNVDQAIAGLLQDLKLRGLLEDTLVVWTSEFGRTPFNAAADARGREHHHWVYSSWIAGAGVRAGSVYGASDDYGIDVAQDPVHLHDFHATLLHLMGIDHERLTFRHNGRDHRLTDVAGNVVPGLLA